MKTIFRSRNHTYNFRTNTPFQEKNIRTVYNGTETISFRGPRVWAIVPGEIKDSDNLKIFKAKIKYWKPEACTCRMCKNYVPQLGFL